MKKNLIITVDIDLKNKNICIAEETSSGAKYEYNNFDELINNIQTYLQIYYKDVIEQKQ